MIKKLNNKSKILFSLAIMLISGLLIIKGILDEHNTTEGYVENIECHKSIKNENTYSYVIELTNGELFGQGLNIACDSIAHLQKGDLIEVDGHDSVFVQVRHKGVALFDKPSLTIRKSGTNIPFIIAFILAASELVFRLYFRKRWRNTAAD